MNCKIRDTICWIVLPLLAVLAEESITLHKFREPGDSLDISIRQELNRSTSIAVEWLRNKQSDEGYFGSKSSVDCTALCIIALRSVDNQPYSNQVAKAVEWLKRNCGPAAATNMQTTAWCYAAFITSPLPFADTEFTEAARTRLLSAIHKKDPYIDLYVELLNSTTLSSISPSEKRLESLKDAFNSEIHPPLEMWINARIINRWTAGRIINPEGNRIDWRRIYARKLISSQRIDPEGGGYWPGPTRDKSIYNTALAILTAHCVK